MGASGIFGKRNLSRIDVDLQFPREIYANRTFYVRTTLYNKRAFLPAFLMKTRLEESVASFPFVDRKAQATAHLPFSFSRRGRNRVGNIYLESRFPFNFFVRARKIEKSVDVLVFPEPLAADLMYVTNEEIGKRGESSGRQRGEGSELITIREYIPGDPIKYINWKASAKTDLLKTTEFASLSAQPVTIDFDKVDIKNVEEKISSIAFTVLHLLKRNIPVGFRIGNVFYSPAVSDAHRFSIMKELALYGHER